MSRVILIAGAAGSGKGTAAKVVRKTLPGTQEWALADPLKQFVGGIFGWSHERLYGPSELRNQVDELPPLHDYFLSFRADRWQLAELVTVWLQDKQPADRSLEVWRDEIADRLNGWWVDHIEAYVERTGGITPRHALQTLGTETGRGIDENVWVRALEWRVKNSEVPVVVVSDARFNNEFEAAARNGWELWHVERTAAGLDGEAGRHASEVDMHGPTLRQLRTHHYVNEGTIADLEGVVRAWC